MFDLTPFERRSFDLFNTFRDMEKNFFADDLTCRTDIRDEKDRFVMEAELPGFDKEDIALDINGSRLTLTAEHKSGSEDSDTSGKYIRRERRYGSYKRTFDVSGIESDKICAEYKNGILTVELPKKAAEIPQSRRLEIN